MPKFDASRFYKYDEIVDFLSAVEKQYPNLVSVSSIGKSHEGRDIMLATLTNKKTGPDTESPPTGSTPTSTRARSPAPPSPSTPSGTTPPSTAKTSA